MYDFSYPLGNAVKSTRYQRGLTQLQVADMADIDVRTVMNIENYKANPKMEVLYPLVRALRIDARTIFTPELQRESPALQQLRLMVEECSEQEAEALIPVMESVLSALRAKDTIEIIKKQSLLFPSSGKSRLCALSIWLVAQYHLQFYHIDQVLFFTFLTVQREFY